MNGNPTLQPGRKSNAEPGMKYRCPYCRAEFEVPDKRSACPLCGKTVLLPGFFRKRTRPRESPPRRLERTEKGARLTSLLGARRPASLLFIAGIVLVCLILLPHSKQELHGDNIFAAHMARKNMFTLREALAMFCDDCRRFPSTREGLVSLVHNPGAEGWKGPYIKEFLPDPWKRPFCYTFENGTVTLFCAGADGIPGTSDDIHLEPAEDGGMNSRAYTVTLPPAP